MQVMLFKDRLEIINPGTLSRGWTVEDLLKTHDSKPRNELLATAMSWTSFVEKSGSGTRDIIKRCVKWGLGSPEYHPQTADFKTIVWRNGFGPSAEPQEKQSAHKATVDRPQSRPQSGPQSRPQSWPESWPLSWPRSWPKSWPQSTDNRILSLLYFGEKSRSELAEKMGVSFRAGSLKRSLARLLEDNLIEYTVQKENSRLQKYRLTAKARRLLIEGDGQ